MGTTGEAVTEMDITGLADGQKAGLCSMGGRNNNLIGIMKKESGLFVYVENNGKTIAENPYKGKKIYLKVKLDVRGNINQFFYSPDNKKFTRLGETFHVSAGFWKGTRLGLYSYNEKADGGIASFKGSFTIMTGPKANDKNVRGLQSGM
jgi:beta-xylosidase